MKKKFTQRERALAAQLGQAFNRYDEGIFKLNHKLVEELDSIASSYGKTFVVQADKIADAHYDLIQAWRGGVLIAHSAEARKCR